jgi:hypothetical protein
MSSNSTTIADDIRSNIEEIIEMVSGEDAQKATADAMERQIWWGILAVGAALLKLFFAIRSELEAKPKQLEIEKELYEYIDQTERNYVSVFGPVKVERAYYWKKGGGKHPLDEGLSLPERSYSDWVQEMVGELSVTRPEDEAVGLLERWFRLNIPKRSAQHVIGEHSELVEEYYMQNEAPKVDKADTIMVALADGKGIRMNRKDSPPPEARRGKGKPKTAKKEAIVTGLYTISPYRRTSDDVIRALMPGHLPESQSEIRPKPSGKQVFGTMAGKHAAMQHLAAQVARRETAQSFHRVALTDGAIALQQRVEEYLPDFTLILDLIHVTEYLWKAAHVLWNETDPYRECWMVDALRCLLEDQLDTFLAHLNRQCAYLSPSKRETLTQVINYLERNRPYMQYHLYLARGWPIGSGVIEGACRHLVKDRFELAGMRWSLKGAQAMLDLRAVYLNGDWDTFQQFRRIQVHEQRFLSSHPAAFPEIVAFEVAA